MKDILGMLLVGLLALFSCGEGNHSNNEGDTTHVHHDAMHGGQSELTLNNGQKWQADSTTNAQVYRMQQIVADFEESGSKDYQMLGKNLQEEANSLIKQCSMKGADHDALHDWLYPFLDDIKALQNPEEAEGAYAKVTHRLRIYNDYFT